MPGFFVGWRAIGILLAGFSGVDQGLELGMGLEDVLGDGAEDVDAEGVFPGVLEGGGDEFEGDAFSALRFGDFCVPDRHPAMAVGFEFEVAGLAVLLDLEAAAGDLGGVVHGRCSGIG